MKSRGRVVVVLPGVLMLSMGSKTEVNRGSLEPRETRKDTTARLVSAAVLALKYLEASHNHH